MINFTVGDKIYKYTLLKPLGQGSFGSVWLAHDSHISRDVALKILEAKDVKFDDLLLEAQCGNCCEHHNLVKVHCADIISHKNISLVLIAMDYHKQGSILSCCNTNNFIALPDAIRYVIDILKGLSHLHTLGFYHNDIKPKNILIGDSKQALLTDYGITSQSTTGESVQPRNIYQPHIAPEMIGENQINIQTDIYQVGITAFRLLNDIDYAPRERSILGSSKYLELVKSGQLIKNSSYLEFIPSNLKTVINKAMSNDLDKRYKSACEMQRAFEKLKYRGYWTTDAQGEFIGHSDTYTYRCERQQLTPKTVAVTAYKKHKTSKIETKISQFSKKNIPIKEADILYKNLLKWVVEG